MDVVSLLLGLLGLLVVAAIAIGLWNLLRAALRRSAAHSGSRISPDKRRADQTASRVAAGPVRPQQPLPTPPGNVLSARPVRTQNALQGLTAPLTALVTYSKADGSTSVRKLTIYSRNLQDGQSRSLNCRETDGKITKQFLVSGISRLELSLAGEPLVLDTPESIRQLLDRVLPVRTSPASRSAQAPARSSTAAAPVPALPFPAAPGSPLSASAPPVALPLQRLLPDGAKGFAVVDLETTGTGSNCRIVELALVRMNADGQIIEEWETLVKPGVPIPNSHIHGIDDDLVAGAPSFADIAGTLAAKLHQHVLVAHKLHNFDGPILEGHFAQVDGIHLSLGRGIDTMPNPRVKLVELCSRHGVDLSADDAHTALGDTRALARALQAGMAHLQPAATAVAVQQNGRLNHPCCLLTRSMAAVAPPTVGWIATEIKLEPGQVFVTTGPQSMASDTEIKRAEAHGTAIGLIYRKTSAIAMRNPPAFLLSTSLTLDTRMMRNAREQQLPVVLCRDFMQTQPGSMVRAWRFHTKHQGTP